MEEFNDVMKRFYFSVEGDNQEITMQFILSRDATWMQILPYFMNFLKAQGYSFDNDHELYDMCDYGSS